jgi:hypothetical protein
LPKQTNKKKISTHLLLVEENKSSLSGHYSRYMNQKYSNSYISYSYDLPSRNLC